MLQLSGTKHKCHTDAIQYYLFPVSKINLITELQFLLLKIAGVETIHGNVE